MPPKTSIASTGCFPFAETACETPKLGDRYDFQAGSADCALTGWYTQKETTCTNRGHMCVNILQPCFFSPLNSTFSPDGYRYMLVHHIAQSFWIQVLTQLLLAKTAPGKMFPEEITGWFGSEWHKIFISEDCFQENNFVNH